jgi:hypothetical protein
MSRVTPAEQFTRYQHLSTVFKGFAYSRLEFDEQLELNFFYQPAKVHSLKSLQTHQQKLREQEPSLPNKAGVHYRHLLLLEELERNAPPTKPIKKYSQGKNTNVAVRGVVRQDINYESLAKVLLEIAKNEIRGNK